MKYCPHCGAPATGTPFCGNCGERLEAASQAASPQTSGAAASSSTGTAAGAAQPSRPQPAAQGGPFSDITVADYARDTLALVLLLTSLGLPWDLFNDVTSKVYVVLVTLLSVVSLSLPYLARAGVFPPSFGAERLRITRLLANVPYVIVVAITVVFDYLDAFDAEGIGVGAVFGLAGAVLAAQPRSAEKVPADGSLWRLISLALGGAIALATIVSVLIVVVDFSDQWEFTALVLLLLAELLVLIGLPLYGFYRRDFAWRDCLVVLGAAALLFGFWQLGSDRIPDAWSVDTSGTMMLLWPALAAAVTAVGVGAYIDTPMGWSRWVRDVVRLMELTVLVGGFAVAIMAVQLSAFEDDRGARITAIVLFLIVTAAALVGRGALSRDAAQGRPVALVVAGVLAVLGIVLAAVLPEVRFWESATLSLVFTLAAAIVAMLTVPASVREELAVLSTAQPAATSPQQTTTSATTAAPTHHVANEQVTAPTDETVHDPGQNSGMGDKSGASSSGASPRYTAQIAADPSTPAEVLADIAATDSTLWPYIAANPATYPALLDWLKERGDPAVDEALRGRSTSDE